MQVWAFNPFSENNWLCIRLYLVIQSVFLLGAITFQKYNALKNRKYKVSTEKEIGIALEVKVEELVKQIVITLNRVDLNEADTYAY